MKDLADQKCVPCHGGIPRMESEEILRYLRQIPAWSSVDDHHISRNYSFSNFSKALEFVNRVATLSEEQGHHPDIGFGWGWAEIKIFTHAIDGLSESDFILAAKIDKIEA
jgi:4a-hydroxytetrahydrobiopterin dehydratase